MADSIKICDCFLDAAVYCLHEDLPYANSFHLCLETKDDGRNTFLIMKNQENCFITSCFDFVKNQDCSDIDWTTLRTGCFYFDSDDVGSVTCKDAWFFLATFSNFCFFSHRIILQGVKL